MSKSITKLLLPLIAACSGQLSLSNLVGGASPASPASSTSPSSASSASSASPAVPTSAGEAESYSLADPPGWKGEGNLLAMPRFFQAATMYWAVSRGAWKALWLADVLGDQLGENARMVLVHWCLADRNDLAYMACTGDAHRLDRKRLAAELAVPEARKYQQSAFENFDAVTKAVAARDAKIAKQIKDDPALAEVYRAIPTATWKQWDAFAATNGPLLATARTLEIASQKRQALDQTKGPSRKTFAGCIDQLAPQFAKVVRAKQIDKATAFVDTFKIATTPATYITTLAMYYCARGNDLALAGALGSELTDNEMLRGPRMATVEAVLAKAHTLKFDDKDYSIGPWRDANYINEDEQLFGDNSGGYGMIKTAQRTGDQLHITFVSEPFTYDDCVRTVPSRDSWHFDRDTGNITPVQECAQWVTKKDSHEIPPIDVPANEGAAIQPGRFLEFARVDKAYGPRAVWDSAKQKHVFAVYGVAR